jgi:hypothetical protein
MIRCLAPILFTCIAVLSQGREHMWNVSCGDEQQAAGWAKTNKERDNMEESWQETQSDPRTRPGWTYSRGASRDSRSSMYTVCICTWIYCCNQYEKKNGMIWVTCIIRRPYLIAIFVTCIVHCSCLMILPTVCKINSHARCLFFLCRLKINHDSHEFSLESDTIVTLLEKIFFLYILPFDRYSQEWVPLNMKYRKIKVLSVTFWIFTLYWMTRLREIWTCLKNQNLQIFRKL